MTVAVIVQARFGSSRLPGKVLLPLGGAHGAASTVLAEVLRRCRAIPGVDVVCCAVPHGPLDDAVAELASAAGAQVSRGSEADVLDRYWQAARQVGADLVMRVTSDCPLIDPGLCGQVIRLVEPGVDYASNNMPPGFPHGLDCEAFTARALGEAAATATESADREHVTPWLRRGDPARIRALAGPGGDLVRHRWTLDYPEDYVFLREVFGRLPDAAQGAPGAIPDWRQTLGVAQDPALMRINESRHQR